MTELLTIGLQFLLESIGLSHLQHFHFMRPYWLLLVIPFFLIYRTTGKTDEGLDYWQQNLSAEVLRHVTIPGGSNKLLTPTKLFLPIWIQAVIVLSGPSWQQQPSPLLRDQSPLVIALDVSQTMNQNDLQPTRLIRAKQKLLQLLALRGKGDTALLVYAGSAHVAMPITNDSAMIKHFLDVLDTDLMPVDGQYPERVLAKADPLLQASGSPGTLLLISDNTNGTATNEFNHYFAVQPHQLLVWGMGKAGKRRNADWHPMQQDKLQQMADQANGDFVAATANDADVQVIHHLLEKRPVTVGDSSQPWDDAGYPLVFVVAMLQLLWFRRGWSLQW